MHVENLSTNICFASSRDAVKQGILPIKEAAFIYRFDKMSRVFYSHFVFYSR